MLETNQWKLTQVPQLVQPNNGLPMLADEYNLCNILGFNGKFPWYVVRHTKDCYSTFWIDKDTKRVVREFQEDLNLREISAPIGALKELQGRLASVLSKLPKHDANYAYMEGRSIKGAADAQVDNDVLIRIDMKDFFGSHFEPYVRKKLVEITGWPKEICWFITKLCSLKGTLPQGAVTSPLLSIVLNKDMDERIAVVAAEHNMVYTRYADDLCFSCSERDDVYIKNFIDEIANVTYPFRINWKKVDIMRNKAKSFACGVTVRKLVPEDATKVAELFNDAASGWKVKRTDTKVIIHRSSPVSSDVQEALTSMITNVATSSPEIDVRAKRFYMQSIKRMLGVHLTDGVKYPRDKYKKMRVEALLVSKGSHPNTTKFKGRLAFMRMVDPAKAEKIEAIAYGRGGN